jgi:hypothetical protein
VEEEGPIDHSSEMYGAAAGEDGGGHPADAKERERLGGVL